jgi:hypothetical protein
MKQKSPGLIVLLTIALGGLLVAQQPPPDGAGPAGPAPPPEQLLAPQQLQDLVAPVALYPDTLLSEILVASTYPLEVVEAQQWLGQNRALTGQQLMEAAQHQNWDPSIQALVAFPGVLARLNQDVRWTTDLGNAFLAQQADVMAAVQALRGRAEANGKLQTTPQENVTTATENGQNAIQIQPVNPETVYVPSYDPAWVWGPPAYGYPPLFYPPGGFAFLPGIDLGFYFGGGWGIYGGFGWGWGPNWFGGGIFVNPYFFHRYGFRDFHPGLGGGNAWSHDASHRLGVPYANRSVASQYRGAAGTRGASAAGIRGSSNAASARAGFAASRGSSNAAEARSAPAQRSQAQSSARQSPGGSRSAFGGAGNGSAARMQSDHGYSSMGHAGMSGGGSRGGSPGGSRGGGGRR